MDRFVVVIMLAGILGACTDSASTAEPGTDPAVFAAGRASFERRCAGCHEFRTTLNKTGPHLAALAERQAAGLSGFPYSDGLRAADFTWTTETLDAYLKDPLGTVPGTSMVIDPVRDPQEREALILFLLNGAAPR